MHQLLRGVFRSLPLPFPARLWLRSLGRRLLRNEADRLWVVLRRMPKRAVCAELGVWKGGFSRQIITITRPRRLHLIDPWRCEEGEEYKDAVYGAAQGADQASLDRIHQDVETRFRREIAEGTVRIHRATSTQAADCFPDEYFGWIYVDGNHLYDFVKADLQMYIPKVVPGGYIAGDDYRSDRWWGDGVQRAVDEVVASGQCELVTAQNGQFVLRRTAS